MAVFPPHVHHFAWGIAVALAALMGLLALPTGRLRPAGRWLALVVAITLAINFVAAHQRLQAARSIALWGAYLCVFLYCAGLKQRGDGATRIVLGAVALSGTALAVHGLYQSFYGFERLAAAAQEHGLSEALRARIRSGRAVATLGLPDALSGMLALSIPITFMMAWDRSAGTSRRLGIAALAVVQTAGLLATWSAGGLVSLALGAAGALWWRGRLPRGATGRRLAVALVVIGLVGAALLLAARLTGPGSEGEGNPWLLRQGNWKVAFDVIREDPLFGAGAGCFGIAFPMHRVWGMNETRFVHNSYLQIFSEMGLFLGALGLIAAGWLAWRLRETEASGFLTAACLGFLVHNTADFTFYVPSVGLMFFSLAGMAASRATPPADPAGRSRRVLKPLGVLVLAAFALLVTRADMKREAAREAVVEKELHLAESLSSEAVRLNPFDPESISLLSHLSFDRAVSSHDADLLRRAEEQALRAAELDPRTPHHWNHLGRVLLARGDPQGAYIALARAARLYPIKLEYRRDRDAVGESLASKKPEALR